MLNVDTMWLFLKLGLLSGSIFGGIRDYVNHSLTVQSCGTLGWRFGFSFTYSEVNYEKQYSLCSIIFSPAINAGGMQQRYETGKSNGRSAGYSWATDDYKERRFI